MSSFFNLGSLALGVISWIMPMVAIRQARKGRNPSKFFFFSFTSCATALVFQLFEIRHRVNLEDFSAIMDTIGAICFVSAVLVVVTVVLNAAAVCSCSARNE